MNNVFSMLNQFFKETFYPQKAVLYYDLACILEPNFQVNIYCLLILFKSMALLCSLK